jgi:CCR4-NOT transcription complex subunit 2
VLISVGMVKQPTAEASEFTMSSEDFPALPGTQSTDGPSPGGSVSGDKCISGGVGSELGSQESTPTNRAPGAEKSQAAKRGIQTSPDGECSVSLHRRSCLYHKMSVILRI